MNLDVVSFSSRKILVLEMSVHPFTVCLCTWGKPLVVAACTLWKYHVLIPIPSGWYGNETTALSLDWLKSQGFPPVHTELYQSIIDEVILTRDEVINRGFVIYWVSGASPQYNTKMFITFEFLT